MSARSRYLEAISPRSDDGENSNNNAAHVKNVKSPTDIRGRSRNPADNGGTSVTAASSAPSALLGGAAPPPPPPPGPPPKKSKRHFNSAKEATASSLQSPSQKSQATASSPTAAAATLQAGENGKLFFVQRYCWGSSSLSSILLCLAFVVIQTAVGGIFDQKMRGYSRFVLRLE